MPKYTTNYTRNVYTYTEIKRNENIALFEGVTALGSKQFEVHVLRDKQAHPKSNNAGEMILCSPSTSEWGRFGFTYQTREKADEKFQSLAMATDENGDSSDSVTA
jgi:hypothetical protein